VEAFRKAGKKEEAEKLISEYKSHTRIVKLTKYISTVAKLKKDETPSPTTIMHPWLKEGQITIIYANYGVGKSLLSILVGYMCGLKEFDTNDCEIAEWFVKTPTGCLYVDGELGEKEMVERVSQYEWLGTQHRDHKMQILSIPDYQIKTEDVFYLGERKNQLELVSWLKDHPTYKLIILDSVSTLFGLTNENDNSEWGNKVNPFLRDLRALNVACLLLHHSGKSSKTGLRGASAMGAMAQNIFKLEPHEKYNIDNGEAWFVLKKDKQRSGGKQFKTFSIHFYQNEEKTETNWEITENY
jgi:RecA-family ATPase